MCAQVRSLVEGLEKKHGKKISLGEDDATAPSGKRLLQEVAMGEDHGALARDRMGNVIWKAPGHDYGKDRLLEGIEAIYEHARKPLPTSVEVLRVPEGGIQPQAVLGADGTIHLVYFKGAPKSGDLFYVHRARGGDRWSDPMRVNQQDGAACALGTIRGAQLAIGREGRVHVAWNGSPELTEDHTRTPLLYARLADSGTAFEPERNLIQWAWGLDGGGSIAADGEGNVVAAWHASAGAEGEAGRAVYVAISQDDGATFDKEVRATKKETGACGCCGLRAGSTPSGDTYVLFRGARENKERGMVMLRSTDLDKGFRSAPLDRWESESCPMSSADFAASENILMAAWEKAGQVYCARVDPKKGKAGRPFSPEGKSDSRKHPVVVPRFDGSCLLVWTEGTGWQKGGSVSWQVFDRRGKPVGDPGLEAGVPVWSFAAGWMAGDGSFVVIY